MCQLLEEAVLVIQKFNVMSKKDSSWHGIKTDILRITYSIFSILISKSVLVYFILAPTSFDDTDLIIAWLYPVICRIPFIYFIYSIYISIYIFQIYILYIFVDILYANYFSAIMAYQFRVLQILSPGLIRIYIYISIYL